MLVTLKPARIRVDHFVPEGRIRHVDSQEPGVQLASEEDHGRLRFSKLVRVLTFLSTRVLVVDSLVLGELFL